MWKETNISNINLFYQIQLVTIKVIVCLNLLRYNNSYRYFTNTNRYLSCIISYWDTICFIEIPFAYDSSHIPKQWRSFPIAFISITIVTSGNCSILKVPSSSSSSACKVMGSSTILVQWLYIGIQSLYRYFANTSRYL